MVSNNNNNNNNNIICIKCGREFNGKKGLNQHNRFVVIELLQAF
jgi:hypothetical protein